MGLCADVADLPQDEGSFGGCAGRPARAGDI
jgi:hypothetical protein